MLWFLNDLTIKLVDTCVPNQGKYECLFLETMSHTSNYSCIKTFKHTSANSRPRNIFYILFLACGDQTRDVATRSATSNHCHYANRAIIQWSMLIKKWTQWIGPPQGGPTIWWMLREPAICERHGICRCGDTWGRPRHVQQWTSFRRHDITIKLNFVPYFDVPEVIQLTDHQQKLPILIYHR